MPAAVPTHPQRRQETPPPPPWEPLLLVPLRGCRRRGRRCLLLRLRLRLRLRGRRRLLLLELELLLLRFIDGEDLRDRLR